jgi:DNA-binding transcriptional LysR family regulator
MKSRHRDMPTSYSGARFPHRWRPASRGDIGRRQHMNWRVLDLNLLVVFDAVMHERSATGAAARLHMTQPAVSQALSRLRSALKDELFIRTPDGMDPTPYAARLADPIRRALEEMATALDRAAEFAPAAAERTFRVALNNHSALVIAAPLVAAVAAEAPGITLDLRPSGTLNVADQLDRGDLDLAIGAVAAPGERFADLRLFEDGFAAVLRRGHPASAADGTITLRTLASVPHLAVSSTGEGTGFLDAELARHGLKRHVAARAPLLAAGSVLAESDMVALLSARAAREFTRTAPLQVLQLPFASPRVVTALLWHRRLDDVAAHRWLRGVVRRIAKTLNLLILLPNSDLPAIFAPLGLPSGMMV